MTDRHPHVVDDSLQFAQHNSNLAKAKIEALYPIDIQLNILNGESEPDKVKMRNYINACRQWSKGNNPDPHVLETIKP